MRLHEITATPGSTKEAKRVGRGHGSGNGKTAGKGHKGQKARSGGGVRVGFEGGQMPLHRRLPRRGFNNIFAIEVTAINVQSLNKFEDGAVVTLDSLKDMGIIKRNVDNVKVLSNGTLSKKLTVQVNSYSEAAKAKIEAAGGKAEVV